MINFTLKESQEKCAEEILLNVLKTGSIGKTDLTRAYGDKSIMGAEVNQQRIFDMILNLIYYDEIKLTTTLRFSCKKLNSKKTKGIEEFKRYMYSCVRNWV